MDYASASNAATNSYLSGLSIGAQLVWLAVMVAALVLTIVGTWRVYTKAGQKGWASLIPFYNLYIQLKIVGRPGWWLLLYFIPIVDIIIVIIVALDLAKSFGKGTGFGIGLWLLNTVFMLILGFGDAQYVGPAAAQPATPVAPAA